PATQWLMLWMSALNGATNRGFGSHGFDWKSGLRQDGEIVLWTSVWPSDRPPLVVEAMTRSTYELTARFPLLGSTMLSVPSPPNGETICLAPGLSRLTPLSCSPPQM